MMYLVFFMGLVAVWVAGQISAEVQAALGMVNQWQRLFYNGHCAESLIGDNPDLTAVSASMGVPGTAVHKPEDLAKAVEALFKTEGPALLDVFIPADENVYPMVRGGKRLDQMVLGGEGK